MVTLQRDSQPPAPTAQPPEPVPLPTDAVVPAVSQWLAARWLPAPAFQPDPAWLDVTPALPEPAMPPAAFAVISGLLSAQTACLTSLGLDPTQPADVAKLARVVRTLNRRLADLPPPDATAEHEWQLLATLNDQADTVRDAVAQGVFAPPAASPAPLAPWRPLLSKLKALAPLIAIARTAKLDFSQPGAPALLAEQVRRLRAVRLPPLENPLPIMQLIAQCSAIQRLQKSLGADPRRHPLSRVRAAVLRKVALAAEQLPSSVMLENGQLLGMPAVQPNPSQLINPATLQAAQRIDPGAIVQLRWQVPSYDQLDLLTTGTPVAALVGLLQSLGLDPVRTAPCGSSCDAGPVAIEKV